MTGIKTFELDPDTVKPNHLNTATNRPIYLQEALLPQTNRTTPYVSRNLALTAASCSTNPEQTAVTEL